MKRLLFIAHRMPYPPDKGERLRAFHEIKALADHFRVTVAALTHSPADVAAAEGLRPMCQGIVHACAGGPAGLLGGAANLLTGRSLTEGYFRSARLRRRLRDQSGRQPFDVAVGYCSGVLDLLLSVPARTRVLDFVDVDSAKWAGYAEAARGPRRWLYGLESRRVRQLEQRALRQCDAVFLVSQAEAAILGGPNEKVLAVGNGVDMDFFTPAHAPAADGPSVVFAGTMDYRPNVEAACWFARQVWPAVRQAAARARFIIVGRDPAPAVCALAKTPGVHVTGTVPDVRPYLAGADVAVAPLLMARGIQNKVLEAMAMGRAVVASPAALEGLHVRVGENVLQAQAPRQWAESLVTLLRNRPQRVALGLAARRHVEAHYSWPTQMAPLISLCVRLADEGKHARSFSPNDPALEDRQIAARLNLASRPSA